MRTLGARADANACVDEMRQMGQWLLKPPTVKGWDGEAAWLNAATFVARADCARRIVLGSDAGIVRGDAALLADVEGERDALVAAVSTRVLGAPLSADVTAAVLRFVDDVGGDARVATIGAILALPEASVV